MLLTGPAVNMFTRMHMSSYFQLVLLWSISQIIANYICKYMNMFAQMHMGFYLQLWSTSQILANYICSAMVHPADTKANTALWKILATLYLCTLQELFTASLNSIIHNSYCVCRCLKNFSDAKHIRQKLLARLEQPEQQTRRQLSDHMYRWKVPTLTEEIPSEGERWHIHSWY